MTDEFPEIEEPTPQPLHFATREEIARTPGVFADTVAGALNTHALWRVRNLESDPPESRAFALAVLADTDRYMRSTLRTILHSSEQAALEDVTSLTDAQVQSMVEELWPTLVQVHGEA